MSAAKFTPGPWRLDAPVNAHVISDDYHTVDAGCGFLASADQREPGFGLAGHMTLADARLIAASPLLFDALETLAGALTTGAGRDFIEAFLRDAKAALEEAAPGWNMLAEPSRQKLRDRARVRDLAPELLDMVRRLFTEAVQDRDGAPGTVTLLEAKELIAKAGGAS